MGIEEEFGIQDSYRWLTDVGTVGDAYEKIKKELEK